MSVDIHKTATVEDGAKLADGVTIGAFCFIGRDVVLDKGVSVEASAIIRGKTRVAKNSKIFSFSVIGSDSLSVTIGESCVIREFVRIGIDELEDSKHNDITIGSECFLMGYVQVYSGVRLANNCTITNAVRLCEGVECEERVVVGGLTTIETGCKIGTGVMVGGASVVDRDIPPFMLVEGNKANIKGLNVIGLRRRLENRGDIEDIKGVFKKILGKKADKALAEEIAGSNPNEFIKRLASFVATNNI